jgi:hypothetical protein
VHFRVVPRCGRSRDVGRCDAFNPAAGSRPPALHQPRRAHDEARSLPNHARNTTTTTP